jgi:GAF domain/PilZ domain/Sel1 repeat
MALERRRLSRHRIQTPAYASVLGNSGGVITDANEAGIAIQGVAALPVPAEVSVRLDLLETRCIVEAEARVVWSDPMGRSGLEFHELTPQAHHQLQQWLLVNALSQWAAAPEAPRAEAPAVEPSPVPPTIPTMEDELAQAAQNALAATTADGAVVALLTAAGDACCFASAGGLAPPVGSHLDSSSGISGACLRSGRLMRCDDAASDSRVDAESCRALGISSVAAAPVLIGGKVAGLVEIFSSRPYAFSDECCSTLQALAASVAVSVQMQGASQAAGDEPAHQAAALSPDGASLQPSAPPPAAPADGRISEAPPAESERSARVQPPLASAVAAHAVGEANRAPQIAPPRPAEAAAAAGKAELQASPAPSTLASEFAALPLPQAEPGYDLRKRLLLILPVVGLFVLGIVVLFLRSGNPTSAAAPAALPETAIASNDAPRNLPKLTLSAVRAQAERGDANAEFELGAKYASGEDVPQNYAEAVKWFTQAADQGNVLAAATLGAFYWAGRGLPQDYVSAYTWSTIAKEGGDEASKYRVAILASRMTASEVNQAQRRATAWLQDHPKFVASKGSTAPPQ